MNYEINFNPEGGDLGRANIRYVTPLELQLIVPHIAYILNCLYELGNSRLPYKYAIEFLPHDRQMIDLVMSSIKLPQHVKWYSIDGMKIFEMRGASGGVVSGYICYLVTEEKRNAITS